MKEFLISVKLETMERPFARAQRDTEHAELSFSLFKQGTVILVSKEIKTANKMRSQCFASNYQ